ncbi:hypothetical protein ACOSQ2_028701 [Xanthoceras sorbifolium]
MPLFCEESPLNPKFIIFSQSPQLLHSLALSESESLTSQIHATSLLACRNHHSSNMCRYRAWEDDIPDGEVYEQNHEEHRNEATDFLLQLEECMNEMREMIDSIKEINKRLKRINYFLCAFLFVLCILEGLKYFVFRRLSI